MFSVLTNYWILAISRIYSVFEARPNCVGEPLKPEQFSNKENVGFIRDVCVDIIARNLYNSLGFPVSKTCRDLANMRTSTCPGKCLKWKRLSKWNRKATNEEVAMAEELMEELLEIVANNVPENTYMKAGEFVYDRINDAKRKLIDSEIIDEDSYMIDHLEDMKLFLCKHCAVSDSKDLKNAIHEFISNEAQSGSNIFNPRTENTVVAQATMTGIFRLKFDYKTGTDMHTGTVITKIPSLAPFSHTRWKRSITYMREAYFYGSILPELYQIGKCQPFAPNLYAITQEYALVLEDLSTVGYRSTPRSESLDLNHCRIFLNVLAQYHAFSYVYLQTLDDNNSIKQAIGSHTTTIRKAVGKNAFNRFCKILQPLLSETLFQKVLMEEDKILTKFPTKNENDPNSMTVIMHGDLHRKNFLFKYNSYGKVCGVKLLDWQFSTEGSPALDLIEFIVENIHEEFFEANEDHLLEFYITSLNRNLSSIQINRVYSRQELDIDMAFFKYYYFTVLRNVSLHLTSSVSSEDKELFATNIKKWVMYLEKKGFI